MNENVANTTVRERVRVVGNELERADRRTRALAVEHPFMLLGGAVVFGYVCGRLLRNL